MSRVAVTRRARQQCVAGLLVLTLLPLLPVRTGSRIGGVAAAQARPMTPTLLRRLAEAVDGHRTGTPVWVVAGYRFPNPVYAVSESRPSAVTDSTSLGTAGAELDIGIFGPFVAPPDTVRDFEGVELRPIPTLVPDIQFVAGCKHDRRTSVMQDRAWLPTPFPLPAICPQEWFPREAIQSITMTYVLVAGDTVTRPVPPWVDALFFTVPALDKFVFPYYARVVGMEEVTRLRGRLLRSLVP